MLCPSCKNFRPANNGPCPWCNAPAAQAGTAWGGQNTSFGGNQDSTSPWGGSSMPGDGRTASGQLPFAAPPWQDPVGSGAQQLPFAGSGVQQFGFTGSGAQPAPSNDSFWSQTLGTGDGQSGQPGKQMSLVPYQPQPGPNAQSLMALPNGFPTLDPNVRAVNPLLPALPDQEEMAYIPPMYTKPRPIIPRYRAISGLLSVIVVFALLCSGAGYFAQVTGKLTPLEKFLGLYSPAAMATGSQALPVPPTQQTPGPASAIVYSVGLGASFSNGQVPTYTNQFTVGQTIYLACSVNAPVAGTVTVKWYTNGNYDKSTPSKPIPANNSVTVDITTQFATPARVKADIYWNNQLADTLFLVVEPAAQ